MPYKHPQDLQPGERVVIDVPCIVTVESVEGVEGSADRGNVKVTYRDPEIGSVPGEFYMGSALNVEVVE